MKEMEVSEQKKIKEENNGICKENRKEQGNGREKHGEAQWTKTEDHRMST